MKNYINKAITIIKNQFNIYFLKGNSVICEMCNWKGKYFPNNKCPQCSSLPRTRLIPYSTHYFNINENQPNILHVAPNFAEHNFIVNKFKIEKYDGLDICEGKKYVNLIQDLTNTSIKDNEYDLIIIWHVLEHIPNDKAAISEMYRILKKGGKALVSVPIFPDNNLKTYEDLKIERKDFEKIHGHVDHCRSCGLDYYERFEAAGFRTNELQVKTLSSDEIKKYGLSNIHTVWLFEK